jgi:hypothetical protein
MGQPRRGRLEVTVSERILRQIAARAATAKVSLGRTVEELLDVGLAAERCRHVPPARAAPGASEAGPSPAGPTDAVPAQD